MTGHTPPWFRRHGRAMFIVFATGAVVAVGLTVSTALHQVRTAARRMADS